MSLSEPIWTYVEINYGCEVPEPITKVKFNQNIRRLRIKDKSLNVIEDA